MEKGSLRGRMIFAAKSSIALVILLVMTSCAVRVLEVEPALDVDYSRHMREKEIQRITQELSLILEQWVSAHPEQYFWIHRRWKSTPEGKWLYQKKQ